MRLALAVGIPLLLTLLLALWLAPRAPDVAADPTDLPWNLRVAGPDSVRVFGLDLGRTTLAEAQDRFGGVGIAGVFRDPDGRFSAEAYFDGLELAGLEAKLVLELAAEQARFEAWERQAQGRVALRSGAQRLQLPEAVQAELLGLRVRSVTYAPRADLSTEVLRGRFGEPQSVLRLNDSLSHWLYPERGLDIMVNDDGRDILQFVLPAEFDRLRALIRPPPAAPDAARSGPAAVAEVGGRRGRPPA